MHKILKRLVEQLQIIITQLDATISSTDSFGRASGNWSFPGLTKAELIEEAQALIQRINEFGGEHLQGTEDEQARVSDYYTRLQYLHQSTIANIWGNAGVGVPTYLETLRGLNRALDPVLKKDEQAQLQERRKKINQSMRSMEARMADLEPRTESLRTMVERIEMAYQAADQLPTDLQDLKDAREKIGQLLAKAIDDKGALTNFREEAKGTQERLTDLVKEAQAALLKCEAAYSASTSVGLASAFSERSKDLSVSMRCWVGGLTGAMAVGSYFGTHQLNSLAKLITDPQANTILITLNLLLSVLAVGGPVWFAWLATKQIGQRFRLAEDYAYKASVSRAYEGYRREAARVDAEMEVKLLDSALTRLDEAPLRLVETQTHGSPYHELAQSQLVKQAMKIVPNFADQVNGLAERALDVFAHAKAAPKKPSTGEPDD